MIIEGVITTCVTALLYWAAIRGRPKVDPQGGILLFRYSTASRGVAILLALCFALILFVAPFRIPVKDESDAEAMIGMVVVSVALAGPLLWETMCFSVIVSPEGLDCRSPWRGKSFISWRDVEDVSYGAICKWFIIRTTDGRTFRVPFWVSGISEFLAKCEYHLGPSILRRAKTAYQEIGRRFPPL